MLRLDINLIFTIANLIILYFLLRKFLINPVRNVMEARKQLIENSLKEAADTKEAAYQLKDNYEQQLAGAKEDATKIITKAQDEATAEYNKKMQEAVKDAAKIKKDAAEAMEVEAAAAKREMQAEVAGLAMAAAMKVIGDSNTEIQNKALYDTFLQEVGE